MPTVATTPRDIDADQNGGGLALFLRRWVSNPRRIGAIVPSAKPLARTMARASAESRCGKGPVVELGPGTGSITRALLEYGIEEAALVLIERDLEMCRWLERRFPHAEVVEGEAADIGAILDERAIVAPSVVVSSLPLRNMAEEERDAIVRASFEVLPRDGVVVQFTYARRPSIACERLGVACRRAGFTALNVPPASVWRIARP